MTRAAFLAGVSVGILVCLWWIARSIGTAEAPKLLPAKLGMTYTLRGDSYTEQLADILRREAW